ncbi:hypothetical protein CWC25_02180 [Pseudoalteromonas sp. S4389]|uniref:hypothetical protein n=1 Tax=Pseudoalteromonas sp. S4389 TaxID=579556 RepID=UPI00110854D2|nr:hypothetical protein [Pseudoalteromonas sp. S4389]TMO47080.1 hypothetical protein CWC25_02180 [Pseudoalteromonas sp. S4389]
MKNKCNVFFRGKLIEGTCQETATKALANTLRIDEKKSHLLFSGKKVIIKKNLSCEQGIKIVNHFLKSGLVLECETFFLEEQESNKQSSSPMESIENQRTVDIWYAIKSSIYPHIYISLMLFFAALVFGIEILFSRPQLYLYVNLLILLYTIPVWKALSHGYEAKIDLDSFSFPASDVENSVLDIITLKKLRNMMSRTTIRLSEIRALNNEKSRRASRNLFAGQKGVPRMKDVWLLNISGDFGSQQLEFNSKQKRDECRSMLFTACYKKGNRLRGASDLNLDL